MKKIIPIILYCLLFTGCKQQAIKSKESSNTATSPLIDYSTIDTKTNNNDIVDDSSNDETFAYSRYTDDSGEFCSEWRSEDGHIAFQLDDPEELHARNCYHGQFTCGEKVYDLDVELEPAPPDETIDGTLAIYTWIKLDVLEYDKAYVLVGDYLIDPSGDSLTVTQERDRELYDGTDFYYPKGSSVKIYRITG